jgi:hypothetical protein
LTFQDKSGGVVPGAKVTLISPALQVISTLREQ